MATRKATPMSKHEVRYPVFILSKSRAQYPRMTWHCLDHMGIPYRVIVEEQQRDEYAEAVGADRLLILPPEYQRDYDACMELGPDESRGSGPARNFAWDTSVAEGAARHWIVDDNIRWFLRLHENRRIQAHTALPFVAMEDFVDRYSNVGIAGPQYMLFAPSRTRIAPFVTGTRVFSCILLHNSLPFRWRARYNEDVDLSLRILKTYRWQSVLFNAFLQDKRPTQQLAGGNVEAFYAVEGTKPKSEMLKRLHPDVTDLTWRYNRYHHYVDYSSFTHPLLPADNPPAPRDYTMRLTAPPKDQT